VGSVLRPLLWSLLSLFLAVRAEAAKVLIMRPASASAAVEETVSRLRGEVLSLGLEVAIAVRPAGLGANAADVPAWVNHLAPERQTDAVIDLVDDAAPATIDIWVVDRRSGRPEVSRVAWGPDMDDAPERLAIRAVEALRSRLVELDLATGRAPAVTVGPEPTTTLTRSPPASDAESSGGQIDLQAGAALLTSVDGVGPALMPVVRLGWAAHSWLVLQGTFAGFGSRPTISSAAGSASVAQSYAVVGGCACAQSVHALQPYLALSAGALHTTIEGQADTPADAHVVTRWSFLMEATLGARFRLPGRYHVTLAAHAQVAAPYVAIHFVDTLVATSGRPNLLLSLTVGAWL
jgi:hypothetical protein